jgi:PASTA domain
MMSDYESRLSALLHSITPEPPAQVQSAFTSTRPHESDEDLPAWPIEPSADRRWIALGAAAAILGIALIGGAVIAVKATSSGHHASLGGSPKPAVSGPGQPAGANQCRSDQLVDTQGSYLGVGANGRSTQTIPLVNTSARACDFSQSQVVVEDSTTHHQTVLPGAAGTTSQSVRPGQELTLTVVFTVKDPSGPCSVVKPNVVYNVAEPNIVINFADTPKAVGPVLAPGFCPITYTGLRMTVGPVMPQSIAMPKVAGLSATAARSALTSAGFSSVTTAPVPSPTVAPGRVVAASEPAGLELPPGITITLDISTGPDTGATAGTPPAGSAMLPSFAGQSETEATNLAVAIGMRIQIKSSPSAQVPYGSVIQQTPVAGSVVLTGSTITITVSRGP